VGLIFVAMVGFGLWLAFITRAGTCSPTTPPTPCDDPGSTTPYFLPGALLALVGFFGVIYLIGRGIMKREGPAIASGEPPIGQ
jgi:hypothetical protein